MGKRQAGMERSEYHRMAALEDTMWWYRALHAGLIDRLGRAGLPRGASILDAGCGTGGFLARVREARPDLVPNGLEYDAEAAAIARKKTGLPVEVGSVNAMPYADGAFDAIVSADVLCHAGVHESAALAEFRRCLKPGGVLMLNLPAYRWMTSAHDAHVHNARRYTASGAAQLLEGSGFVVIRRGYWNSLLFPLMVLHRMVAGRASQASDVRPFPPWQDRLFSAAMAVEQGLETAGLGLPFGGSIWIWARKT